MKDRSNNPSHHERSTNQDVIARILSEVKEYLNSSNFLSNIQNMAIFMDTLKIDLQYIQFFIFDFRPQVHVQAKKG